MSQVGGTHLIKRLNLALSIAVGLIHELALQLALILELALQ